MRLVFSVFLLASFISWLLAQNPQGQNPQPQSGEYEPSGPSPSPSAINSIIPLPPSRLLSATQLAGKKLFVQNCSVCHVPGPRYNSLGPLLDGKLVASKGEMAVREKIMHGSTRMPGFQYVFEPAEADKIMTYLKTLTYDPAARKYNYSSVKK